MTELKRSARSLLVALALVFGALSAAPTFAAATATTAKSTYDAPEGFEPLSGKEAKAEGVDANTMVVGAYGAIFVLLLGFVVHVVRIQSGIAKEMQELATKIERKER